MHEYRLTRQLVAIINDAAQRNGAKGVRTAGIVVGQNRSIIPESVQMYFDMIAKGTLSEGAVLNIRVVKPEMYCAACGKNFVRRPFSFECPLCGGTGSPTEVGNEFYVEQIEIED